MADPLAQAVPTSQPAFQDPLVGAVPTRRRRGSSVLSTYEPFLPDPHAVFPDPIEAGLRAAGRGIKSAAMLPVALGKVLYGVATQPIETAKDIGRGLWEEAPTIVGGVAGGLAGGIPTAGIGALPGAILGAMSGKGAQLGVRRLTTGPSSRTPTETLTEILTPGAEQAATLGLGRLARVGGRAAARHLPGTELERGTMAAENARLGARDILPRTTEAQAKGALNVAAEAASGAGVAAESPLGNAMQNAIGVLTRIDPMKFPFKQPMTVATAHRAWQDINEKLAGGTLSQLQHPAVKQAADALKAELDSLALTGSLATPRMGQGGGLATQQFFEGQRMFKEAATTRDILDLLERKGIQEIGGGAGSRMTLNRLLNAIRNPTSDEAYAWKMLQQIDPTAQARLEDVLRSQVRLLPGEMAGGAAAPYLRSILRRLIPGMVGGQMYGPAGGAGAILGELGMEKVAMSRVGRPLTRRAWEEPLTTPLKAPISGQELGAGGAAVALSEEDRDMLRRRGVLP